MSRAIRDLMTADQIRAVQRIAGLSLAFPIDDPDDAYLMLERHVASGGTDPTAWRIDLGTIRAIASMGRGDEERPLRAMIADVIEATPAKTRSAKKRRARRQDRKR